MFDFQPYLHGVYATEQTGAGIVFRRMTPELRAFYNYSEPAQIRADCATNTCLRFRTDSRSLHLKLAYGAPARPVRAVDIAVEGADPFCVDAEDPKAGFDRVIELPGQGGMREVQLNFPHLIQFALQELELESGARIEQAAPLKGKMVLVGDSILQGMTTTCSGASIGMRLGRLAGCDIHNVAVGGAIMQPEAMRLSRALGGTMVAENFGVNDCAQSVPMELFEERARETMALMEEDAGNRRPFVIVPIPYPGEQGPNAQGLDSDDYRNAIRRIAAEYPSITLVDGIDFYPHDKRYFVDSCHPNNDGSALYAEALAKAIKGLCTHLKP